MTRDYIQANIEEQITRAIYLKSLIRHPAEYPEILGLADRCSRILDENINQLRFLLRELSSRSEDDIRDVFRGFRRCSRNIETVEYFGIPALYYHDEGIKFLNKLIFRIYQEIKLPLAPPSAACISTRYYFIHPVTNVIFVPLGESRFLLHLPDIYHELGHQVLFNKENDLRLKAINEKFHKVIKTIKDHYQILLYAKTREVGPPEELMSIENTRSQWKNYWINEFFSDLFACYTLGPAYVWSNLHLVTKKSDDIYKFSPYLPQSHPSDDSRMKMLLIGLNNLGFKKEAGDLLSKWEAMPFAVNIKPVVEYQYAYSNSLMVKVADLVLEGLRDSGFPIATPERIKNLNPDCIIKIFNEAWRVFWKDFDGFRKWEEDTIKKLKSIV